MLGFALFFAVIPFIGYVWNLITVLSYVHVELAHWSLAMVIETLGVFFLYGSLLGWLEIFHIL